MEFEPELLLTGHTGRPRGRPADARRLPRLGPPDRGRLPDIGRGTGGGELRARSELRDPLPYQNRARPGDRLPIELRVTNHGAADATARASLVAPPGWSVSPGEATTPIVPGESGTLRFVVEVPPGAASRHVLCAELSLGERRFGQIAEALVDVT